MGRSKPYSLCPLRGGKKMFAGVQSILKTALVRSAGVRSSAQQPYPLYTGWLSKTSHLTPVLQGSGEHETLYPTMQGLEPQWSITRSIHCHMQMGDICKLGHIQYQRRVYTELYTQ